MIHVYTTAPIAYDGFGTETIEEGKYIAKDKPVKLVKIHPEHHVWQTMRYASGMHLCIEENNLSAFLGWYIKEVK